MENLVKTLDLVVKAPLWVFLALALATTVPLIPMRQITDVGLNSSIKLAGLPIAAFSCIFWAFFIASALARFSSNILVHLIKFLHKNDYLKPYRNLSDDARWLLAAIEENEYLQITVSRSELAVRELRDANLISYIRSKPYDEMMGIYETTPKYQTDMMFHRAELVNSLRRNLPSEIGLRSRIEQYSSGL